MLFRSRGIDEGKVSNGHAGSGVSDSVHVRSFSLIRSGVLGGLTALKEPVHLWLLELPGGEHSWWFAQLICPLASVLYGVSHLICWCVAVSKISFPSPR